MGRMEYGLGEIAAGLFQGEMPDQLVGQLIDQLAGFGHRGLSLPEGLVDLGQQSLEYLVVVEHLLKGIFLRGMRVHEHSFRLAVKAM